MKEILLFIITVVIVSACKKDNEFDSKYFPKACFSMEADDNDCNTIQFINCSTNASSYLWEFNDGETSTEKNPLHHFDTEPNPHATLIAKNRWHSDTTRAGIVHDDGIHVYKPNIYIYPLHKMELCLNIEFPLGGTVTESIPHYQDGWCFSVDTAGIINNQYNYLFYESYHPNQFQYKTGWCVKLEDLKSFFTQNMSAYQFSSSEINDFINYWIPKLIEYPYYCIYPQTNEIIEQMIHLKFSTPPDKVHRLFYGIIGSNKKIKLEEPSIKAFERTGFYAIEWGVFLN